MSLQAEDNILSLLKKIYIQKPKKLEQKWVKSQSSSKDNDLGAGIASFWPRDVRL